MHGSNLQKNHQILTVAILVLPLLLQCSSKPINTVLNPAIEPNQSQVFVPQDNPVGVCIVLHGLNNNPAIMNTLCDFLSQNRILTIRHTIPGHDTRFSLSDASRKIWIDSTIANLEKVRTQANELTVPLYSIGFSLGASLLLDAELESGIYADRAVYFAPAIILRPGVSLTRLLSWLPELGIPSLSPPTIRHADATPVAAYSALLDCSDAIQQATLPQNPRHKNWLSIRQRPTAIIADPLDGVVDPVAAHLLSGIDSAWTFTPIDAQSDNMPGTWRHLVVIKEALKPASWDLVMQTLSNFLSIKHIEGQSWQK